MSRSLLSPVRTRPTTYRFVPTAQEDLSLHFDCANVEEWHAYLADASDFPQWLADIAHLDVSGLCCHNHKTVLVYA